MELNQYLEFMATNTNVIWIQDPKGPHLNSILELDLAYTAIYGRLGTGELIFDVPFSNVFQGFRIGLVPISIAGRPTGAKRWNSGTNPALGAQVN